jgi:hypothetical protein
LLCTNGADQAKLFAISCRRRCRSNVGSHSVKGLKSNAEQGHTQSRGTSRAGAHPEQEHMQSRSTSRGGAHPEQEYTQSKSIPRAPAHLEEQYAQKKYTSSASFNYY